MNRSRVTGDLASHGNIFVDIANDRVGIGSTIPAHKLEVRGDTHIYGDLEVESSLGYIRLTDSNSSFDDFGLRNDNGVFFIRDVTNGSNRFSINSEGTLRALNRMDFDAGIHLNAGDLRIVDTIKHRDDEDTKIRFPAADQIQLETGGSSRVNLTNDRFQILNRLLTSGDYNYLSGTSTTTATLTLKKSASGADSIDYLQLRNNSNALLFKISGDGIIFTSDVLASHEGDTNTKIRFPTDDTISFETAGIQAFRNDSSGHFILGRDYSSNPSNGLVGITTIRGHRVNEAGDYSRLYFKNSTVSGSSSASIRAYRDGGNYNTGLSFYLNYNTSSGGDGSERFRINSLGTQVTQFFSSNQTYAANDTTQFGYQAQNKSDVTNTYAALRLTAGNSSPATAQLSSIRTGAGQNDFTIQLESGNTAFEALRIDSSGRLLLGTTTEGFAEGDDLTINSADHGGITIRTPTNKEGNIAFSDTTSGTGEYSGLIRYRHHANDLGLWTSSNLRLLITSDGNVNINSSALSSPYAGDGSSTGFRHISINNNLILNAQNAAGGFAGMQNNAYLNSSGQWVRVNNDHATSIGTDDGNVYFRNAGAGTGTISWTHLLTILANGNIGINNSNPSVQFQLTNTSATILRTEATANSGDALIQALGKNSSGNDRMIQMRTDAGAGQYRIISSDTDYNLALCTGNAPRVLIAGSSAATSIGGSNVFNAMLTTQGDVSGGLLMLKATENTNRLFVTGTNTNGVEVNLYDEGGNQRGILGVSGSEFFIKAPHSNAPMTFHTHNGSSIGERARIDTTGRFLINRTVSNLNAQLQVGGRYVDASTSTLNLDGTGNDGAVLHLMETGNTADRIALMVFDHGSLKSAIGGGRGNASNWGTDLRFYTHKETTTDIHQTYERMRIRPDAITTFGSSGSPYQSNTVSIHPDDGMVCFGMDGRTTLMSNQNSCYIFSGSGASGDIPAGTLILQSRSNVDRNIVFATGATPSEKWIIHGASGALRSYNYLPAGGYSSSTSNGYDIYLKLQGQLPTANSGVETTIINTNSIGDAGVYILVLRSFEQSQTGGKLWSVRIVSSTFYIHSGSGNDAETVTVPVTHMGHHNGGSNPPVTIKMHMDNGPAHTHGKITYTPNNFSYGGTNCDYYFYKLIDV